MSYIQEHGYYEDQLGNAYFDKEKIKRAIRIQKLREELHVEVKKFVQQSSLLVGADKIREILRKLDE